MNRSSYHHGDLANALVAAAIELIKAHGPQGFSLREAARTVGVSPSAAYRHFADREALLAAVAADGFARLADALRAARVADPTQSFRDVGRAYIRFAVDHPAEFAVMFTGRASGASTSESAYDLLTAALDRLGLPGYTRPGAEIVAWSAVHGLSRLLIDGAIPPEREAEVTDRVLAGVTRALE